VLQQIESTLVFNAYYSPDFNLIEGVFSVMTQGIKKQTLIALSNKREVDLPQLLEEEIEAAAVKSVSNCKILSKRM